MKKTVTVVSLLLVMLLIIAVWQRHRLSIWALAGGESPALLAAAEEGPGATWYDDYFTIEEIAADTFAIGEPRYHQQNYSYLIIGRERAVLFDAGPGLYDIRAAAESLTDRPITFVPSHFHFDHVGNRISFDHVAIVDLPYLRERAPDNRLALTWREHLGSAEGIGLPTLQVDEWVAPGSAIKLGGRDLRVLYTPGHTEDSISLLDETTGLVFTGDFIYPGPLFAFLPNSSLRAYLQAADHVLQTVPHQAQLFGAHRLVPPGVPRLSMDDVEDLQRALRLIKAGDLYGEGVYPAVYTVNARMQLLAEPSWLQDW